MAMFLMLILINYWVLDSFNKYQTLYGIWNVNDYNLYITNYNVLMVSPNVLDHSEIAALMTLK